MKNINAIQFIRDSKQEFLPGLEHDFPHISSYVELNKHQDGSAPWHWHKEIELFYVQSGDLVYHTPSQEQVFREGAAGIVNSDILHMTRTSGADGPVVQLVHLFDPSFLGGAANSRIEKKYIQPFISAAQIEVIGFFADNPDHLQLVNAIRESFALSEDEFGYEMKLHSALSGIWLQLVRLAAPLLDAGRGYAKSSEKIKKMMMYIHEHYPEKISVVDVAGAAFISERECYRAFQESLHVTPVEYIKRYRLQMACKMLINDQLPVTAVSHACGFGSSSYFGKTFRQHYHCTPVEYRQGWQNSNI